MSKKVTTEDFIRRAREIHGDRYDYSLVYYRRAAFPVTIVCSTHGRFSQTPAIHLYQKSGCPNCAIIKSRY